MADDDEPTIVCSSEDRLDNRVNVDLRRGAE